MLIIPMVKQQTDLYTEHSQQQKERFSLLLKDILGVFDNDN